jgi:hypothetical protein
MNEDLKIACIVIIVLAVVGIGIGGAILKRNEYEAETEVRVLHNRTHQGTADYNDTECAEIAGEFKCVVRYEYEVPAGDWHKTVHEKVNYTCTTYKNTPCKQE